MDDKCKECGKPAEITSEKIWTSYVIKDGKSIKNETIDDETLEVYFWCEKCFNKSESWD